VRGTNLWSGVALALALVWAITSPASSQESILYPLVQQSCEAWSEERKSDNQNLQIWVLGFLSGASVYGGVNLGELDADAPLRWIDNYCQWHPIDLVTQALAAFINERRR